MPLVHSTTFHDPFARNRSPLKFKAMQSVKSSGKLKGV